MKRLMCVAMAICLMSSSQIFSDDNAQYMSPFTPIKEGRAPGLKYKLLSEGNGVKEYVLVFAPGDEVMSGVLDFALKNNVKNAQIQAIGAFSKAVSAYYEPDKKMFKLNPLNEHLELISLLGDIATLKGRPAPHIHFSGGHSNGTVVGGHMVEAYAFPTVEMYITVYDTPIYKKLVQQEGIDLNLINLDAKE